MSWRYSSVPDLRAVLVSMSGLASCPLPGKAKPKSMGGHIARRPEACQGKDLGRQSIDTCAFGATLETLDATRRSFTDLKLDRTTWTLNARFEGQLQGNRLDHKFAVSVC